MTKTIYEAPMVDYLDMEHEGVLCQSGEGSMGIADWKPGSGVIDF